MLIRHAGRSDFMTTCEFALRRSQTALEAGQVVRIPLTAGGYKGRVVISIDREASYDFNAEWTGSDTTRFPARPKALATALMNCNFPGHFEVAYVDGFLEVRKLKEAR